MLSSEEKNFLTSLSVDPRWERILKSLEKKAPVYRPDDDVPDDKQKSKFIYDSGVFNENDRILKMLRSKK